MLPPSTTYGDDNAVTAERLLSFSTLNCLLRCWRSRSGRNTVNSLGSQEQFGCLLGVHNLPSECFLMSLSLSNTNLFLTLSHSLTSLSLTHTYQSLSLSLNFGSAGPSEGLWSGFKLATAFCLEKRISTSW